MVGFPCVSYLHGTGLQHDEAVVNLSGDEDEQRLRSGRPELEGDVRRAAGVRQGEGDVRRAGEGGWKKRIKAHVKTDVL